MVNTPNVSRGVARVRCIAWLDGSRASRLGFLVLRQLCWLPPDAYCPGFQYAVSSLQIDASGLLILHNVRHRPWSTSLHYFRAICDLQGQRWPPFDHRGNRKCLRFRSTAEIFPRNGCNGSGWREGELAGEGVVVGEACALSSMQKARVAAQTPRAR